MLLIDGSFCQGFPPQLRAPLYTPWYPLVRQSKQPEYPGPAPRPQFLRGRYQDLRNPDSHPPFPKT